MWMGVDLFDRHLPVARRARSKNLETIALGACEHGLDALCCRRHTWQTWACERAVSVRG
jgi:hypothetical protein